MLHNKSANEFKMKFVTFQDVHVVCTQLLFGPIRFKSGAVYTRRGREKMGPISSYFEDEIAERIGRQGQPCQRD